MGVGVPAAEIGLFLELVAATPEQFSEDFRGRASRFDFLPFQRRPILRMPQGLLLLDEEYMWERITQGHYWDVHDHEKASGETERNRWPQAYGEMMEMMVEDLLERLAPPLLGGEGSTFYTEEDFATAYPGKRCDAAIDFGLDLALFEVVSGQLSV